MSNPIGFSVYLSHFEEQKKWLSSYKNRGYRIFTSLHIPEEYSSNYRQQILDMLNWLKGHQFYIIADISERTLTYLEVNDLVELVQYFPIDNIRIDDGFNFKDLVRLPKAMAITFNASTQLPYLEQWLNFAKGRTGRVFAMHNYYRRPETGLDLDYFNEINQIYLAEGIEVMAFIAGDLSKRAPIFEGLPTLECLRYALPVIAYRKLKELGVSSIFVGDIGLSANQIEMIQAFEENNEVWVPCQLIENFEWLYGKVYKIRLDSPKQLLRITDLRGIDEAWLQPHNNNLRTTGSITIDNVLYGRYAGEIQLIGKNLSSDDRVNVIGKMDEAYLTLFELNHRHCKMKFVKRD